MELRQLEYFRVIAETESIHEAARRLNMSQPPLSYQLKQLEAELNVTLFERTRQGVRLTEAGKLLYDRSANLLEYVKSTELEVAKVGKSGFCASASHRPPLRRSCRASRFFPPQSRCQLRGARRHHLHAVPLSDGRHHRHFHRPHAAAARRCRL